MQSNLTAARDNGVSAAALNAAQRDITAAAQKQQRTNDDIARYAKAAQDRLASGAAADAGQRFGGVECRAPASARRAQPDHRAGGARTCARAWSPRRARASPPSKPAEAAALLDAAEGLGGDADLADLRVALGQRADSCGRDRRRRAEAAAAQDDASAASEVPVGSAKGVEGWVRVEFYVTPEGRTERVRVLSSEPAGVFDAAAIEAMESARFEEFDATESRLAVQRIVFKPE